jgi:hypothetical protein
MSIDAGFDHRILLSRHGATVELAPDHDDGAWMLVVAGPDVRTGEWEQLVETAVVQARDRRVGRIDTALDLAAPSTGVLLQLLRDHLGREVATMSMHRAGASVMLTLLISPPESRPTAEPVRASGASAESALESSQGLLRSLPTPRRRRPWSHRQDGVPAPRPHPPSTQDHRSR